MSKADFIAEPCTVTTPTVAESTEGAEPGTQGSPQDATCKIKELSAQERLTGDDAAVSTHRLHLLPTSLDLSAGSKVTIPGRNMVASVVGQPWLDGNDSLGRCWRVNATVTVRPSRG